jgi:HlyD family secretion protein
MNCKLLLTPLLLLFSCGGKVETLRPITAKISESIYASGTIKSKNQYQAFATVNGIIEKVYVSEGDTVNSGQNILLISNETQRLNRENAQLSASFSDAQANQGKLNEAKLFAELAKNKMKNDSTLYERQKTLWKSQIGTKVELEQRELAFQNSKTMYYSAVVKQEDLSRQIDFTSSQSKKNLKISSKLEGDYTLKSEINGIVYSLPKTKGEIVSAQTVLAIIGDASSFILEMQVDENDILKIKPGLTVLVTLDSYHDQVFEARVTKIYPLMNERSKTFLIEAEFTKAPETLYPNINFEGNIIISTKEKALLIPREYIINDSLVIKSDGSNVRVKTGLKDYKMIEIISGITAADELIKPTE